SYRYGAREPRRVGLAHPSIAPYGVFETRDGNILISIQNERDWNVFCETILRQAELAADSRFSSNTKRVRNRDELDRLIQAVFARYGTAELVEVLDKARIAYGRVSTMSD